MINNEDINNIEKLINNKIINIKLLSDSFGINCLRITSIDNINYIVKYYQVSNENFNAIKSEGDNLIYLNNLSLKFFPKVFTSNNSYLIISYIKNNNIQPVNTKTDLLNAIISIHRVSSKEYGFNFDTQIGGLKQINKKDNNWIDFFRERRLGYIFRVINESRPMEQEINNKIEILLNKLDNFIPKNPRPSLLHGDLWEGNILFNNNNFVGLIDPGSFYGHNELEVAYLRWFNPDFVDENFLEKYSNFINLADDYLIYEPIYQLYYSLLNVHLWDRIYIKDVKRLLKKIKI